MMSLRQTLSKLAAVAFLAGLLTPGIVTGLNPAAKADPPASDPGKVDYDRGVVTATGLGAIPNDEPNSAKAYLRARGFARLDALRNLLMLVDHVKIDSETIGSDYEAKSDEIRAEVKGIVRGAQITGERKLALGNAVMVEVTVSAPLYGTQGLAGAIVPEMIHRSHAGAELAAPVQERVTLTPPAAVHLNLEPILPPNPNEPITAVIIDTRGEHVERCMSPKILRRDGSEIWGTVNADPDFVIEHGIVSYARTIADAKALERAGNNPLVLRSCGVNAGRFNSDAVLSSEDEEVLAQADKRHHFLSKYHVIFVVD